MSVASNDKEKEAKVLPSALEDLTEQQLTEYLKNFLRIDTYWKIKQGKQLLILFKSCDDDLVLQKITKKVAIFFEQAPGEARVCTLQFIKQLVEIGHLKVFLEIQKHLLQTFIQTITYRSQVKSITRGSTYFLQKINKHLSEEKTSQLIKLSNTYFRMTHQVLYVWANHLFPSSKFTKIYQKLSQQCFFPKFSEQFKFYTQKKIARIQQEVTTIKSFLSHRQVEQISKSKKNSSRQNKDNGQNSINVHMKSARQSPKKNKDEQKIPKSNTHRQTSNKKQKEGKKQQIKIQQSKILQNRKEIGELSKSEEKKNKNLIKEEQSDGIDDQNVILLEIPSSSILSKVYKKGGKSKIVSKPSKKKIPPNVVYRSSSIEDPIDITDLQPTQMSRKKPYLDIPLSQIPQISLEDGTSREKVSQKDNKSPLLCLDQKNSKNGSGAGTPVDSEIAAYSIIEQNIEQEEEDLNDKMQKSKEREQYICQQQQKHKKLEHQNKTSLIKDQTSGNKQMVNVQEVNYSNLINKSPKIKQKYDHKYAPIQQQAKHRHDQINVNIPSLANNNKHYPFKQAVNKTPHKLSNTKNIVKLPHSHKDDSLISQKKSLINQQSNTMDDYTDQTVIKEPKNTSRSKKSGKRTVPKKKLFQQQNNQQRHHQRHNQHSQEKNYENNRENINENVGIQTKKNKNFFKKQKQIEKNQSQKDSYSKILQFRNQTFDINYKFSQSKPKLFRKFREVAFSYLPSQEQLIKKQRDAQNKITAVLEEEFSRQLADTEDKIKIESQSATAQLKKFLEQTRQSLFSQVSNENKRLLNESQRLYRLEKQIEESRQSEKIKRVVIRSNSSGKRRRKPSLQELSNEFAEGTMLHLLAKRRSVYAV